MITVNLVLTTASIAMMLSGCSEVAKNKNHNSEQKDYRYNVCFVLDGSDLLSNQNEVPIAST